MKTVKRYELETTDGIKIYRAAGFNYTVGKTKESRQSVDTNDSFSKAEQLKQKERVERKTGASCRWVEAGETQVTYL